MNDEQKAALLKPLMHSRLGKIDYTDIEKYKGYCRVFSSFGLVLPDDDATCRSNLRDWLAKYYHDQAMWYLSRGQRQSVSFRSNRIEEHATVVIKNFQKICPVQWVYEVQSYESRHGGCGYVMAKSSAEAEQLGKMMYHIQGANVWVRRKSPAFDKSRFCEYQSASVKSLQKQIQRNLGEIKSLQNKNESIKESITTLQTNLMIFLDD